MTASSPISDRVVKRQKTRADTSEGVDDHNGDPGPSTVSALSRQLSPSPNGESPASKDTGSDSLNGFEKILSKEEKRKEKKRKREEKVRKINRPHFMYNTDGFKHQKRIGIAHIRDLILHVVTEHAAPNWMLVEHRSNISHTVVVLAPGILHTDLGLPEESLTPASYLPFSISETASKSRLPVMSRLFSHACPTRAPGDSRRLFSVVQTLLQTPLSQAEQKKREKQREKLISNSKEDQGDPTIYLLNPNQMLDNGFPLPEYVPLGYGDHVYLPGKKTKTTDAAPDLRTIQFEKAMREKQSEARPGDPSSWRETPKAESEPESGRYRVLAVDCEMCLTEDGQELTRATVIDFSSGKVLFDELCRPKKPVVDYLTRWSGITAEKLQHAKLSLSDVQARLLDGENALITPNTILLGHSLESDLNALRIRHPLCIDTALLYRHPRGPPYKPALKWLCSQWLGRQIQTAGEGGHDSEEDARACIDLLRMKLSQGPGFGDVGNDTESIFERMSRHAINSTQPGRSAVICDYGNPSQWHGARARTAVSCVDDDEILDGLTENVATHDFSFARFMGISAARKWSDNAPADHKPANGVEPEMVESASNSSEESPEVEGALADFNEHLAKLHASLASNTALILLTGHGDPRPMLALNKKKSEFDRVFRTFGPDGLKNLPTSQKWTTTDERDLEEAAMRARTGMAFFCVKAG